MSVSAAVDMIRATPHNRRSDFAAQLRKHMKARKEERETKNPTRKNGFLDWGSKETYVVSPAKAHKEAVARRKKESAEQLRVAAKIKKDRIRAEREELAEQKRQIHREYQQLKIEAAREKLEAMKAKRAGAKGVVVPVVPSEDKIQRAYERGASSLREAVEMAGGRLNPATWKRCNPGRKRNPSAAAADVFEEFHGYPSTELVTVKKKVHHHKHLAAAGELRALKVRGVDRHPHTIRGFKAALLCFNEAKNQLFVEGGDQSINLDDYGIKKPHEIETLGKLTGIDYFTTKTHLGDEGGTAIYQHGFRMTNENGQHVVVTIARYPDLIYRVLDEQLEFSGGSYTIRREGIDL